MSVKIYVHHTVIYMAKNWKKPKFPLEEEMLKLGASIQFYFLRITCSKNI
jgi:hypothetical protein